MSEATQTPTLEQTFNRTDLGHVLYENRNLLFGLILALVVGISGYLGWRQVQAGRALENSQQVFEFQSKTWEGARQGKITPEVLVSEFEKLDRSVQTSPVMIPVALEMGKFLVEKDKLAEANAVLSKISGQTDHQVATFFVSMQHAVVLEKLGKADEAIAVLEKLAKTRDNLMPARISLELGRLHQLRGNVNEARTQFDYVMNTYPTEEYAKMARLYLSQLNQ
jgi:predicted negative regulator of RcsB-dependent stress response